VPKSLSARDGFDDHSTTLANNCWTAITPDALQ
jgi:hypothetical protein